MQAHRGIRSARVVAWPLWMSAALNPKNEITGSDLLWAVLGGFEIRGSVVVHILLRF